jgi:hypothetical protein
MALKDLFETSIRLLWEANQRDCMAAGILLRDSIVDSKEDLWEDFKGAVLTAVPFMPGGRML